MSEGRSAWWREVWVSLTKDVIKDGIYAVLGLLLLSAVLKSVRDWLLADSHVVRGAVVLLVIALLIAVAYLLRARNQGRAKTGGHPEAAVVAADFNPSGVQLAAMAALLKRYESPASLSQLHEQLKPLTETGGGKPFLARQMEDLERAHVVRIDETGRTDRSYSLTTQGRDWYLDQIKDAREHPEEGPQEDPLEGARVAEGFEPTGEQACALVAMIHSYPVTVSIEQLHNAMKVTEGERPTVLHRAHVYREMDGLIAAGVVEVVPSGNYNLTPHGRNFALDYVDRNTSSGTP